MSNHASCVFGTAASATWEVFRNCLEKEQATCLGITFAFRLPSSGKEKAKPLEAASFRSESLRNVALRRESVPLTK